MGWNCSIRVLDENGRPASGATVTLHFHGLMGGFLKEYTDSDGWAEFNLPDSANDVQSISTVYVGSREVASSIGITNGETLSFHR